MSTPKTATESTKSSKSPSELRGAIADVRDITESWMAEYVDTPARTSLVKVLRDTIRRMEQVERGLRAAAMIELGRYPD